MSAKVLTEALFRIGPLTIRGGKKAANDPLRGVNDPLYSLSLCLSTATVPY